MEKGDKTIGMGDQKLSSSFKKLELASCSASIGQTDERDQENKSAKEIPLEIEKSDESDDCDETDFGLMNDFPPEILAQILNNLDAPSLFACRLVNRQWNAISSGILCQRPEVEIEFLSREEELVMGETEKEKSLRDFVECIKTSKNCPFVRFSFNVSDETLGEFYHFLSEFDVERIKSLKLSWGSGGGFFGIIVDCIKSVYASAGAHEENDSDVDNDHMNAIFHLSEKLGDLLLNKIPHLEEFGLDMPYREIKGPKPQLFSSSSSSPIQLANLKVVRLGSSTLSKYPEIMKDLLSAAVNLERIEPISYSLLSFQVSDFNFLDSIGKLDCVKNVEIDPSPNFIDVMKEKMPNLPHLLKLSKLKLCAPDYFNVAPIYWSDVTHFLSALFDSSKHTLTSLTMRQLGFLHSLQFPQFTNLRKLSVSQNIDEDYVIAVNTLFPPGAKSMDIFPAVRSLEYNVNHWEFDFLGEDSFPYLPAVETIQLEINSDLNVQSRIEYLGSISPNVKHFTITPEIHDAYPSLNFLQIGRTIWTHMPKLESLELFIDLDWEVNNAHALDSCFTGFSEENCKRLFDLAEAKSKQHGEDFDAKIQIETESELELESELKREYPSVFDMKDLKKLTINPYSDGHGLARKDFTQKLTWISEKYTLKLMPQLKFTQAEDGEDSHQFIDRSMLWMLH